MTPTQKVLIVAGAVAVYGLFIALLVVPACRWVKRCEDEARQATWDRRGEWLS